MRGYLYEVFEAVTAGEESVVRTLGAMVAACLAMSAGLALGQAQPSVSSPQPSTSSLQSSVSSPQPAASSSAVVGTLEPFHLDSDSLLKRIVNQSLWQDQPKRAPRGCGTVDASAVAATFETYLGPVSVAVDGSSPRAKHLSVARLDPTGSNTFTPQHVQEFTCHATGKGSFEGRSKACTIPMQMGGRTLVLSAEVGYSRTPRGSRMSLAFDLAAKGRCRLGYQDRDIIVIDGNNNLRLGDVSQPAKGKMAIDAGDTLLVADEAGSFESPAAQAVLLGQPLAVGQSLYTVRVDPDTWAVQGIAYDGPVGRLEIAHDKWTALLVGRRNVVWLTGGDQPNPVPADAYAVLEYMEWPEQAGKARLHVAPKVTDPAQALRCEVPAGQGVRMAVGTPLSMEARVSYPGARDQMRVDLSPLLDASAAPGKVAVSVTGMGKLKPPQILFYDGMGRRLDSKYTSYG